MKFLQNVCNGDKVFTIDYTNLAINEDVITNVSQISGTNIIYFYTKNNHIFKGEHNLEITVQNMSDVAMATDYENAKLALYAWCSYKKGMYEKIIFNLFEKN